MRNNPCAPADQIARYAANDTAGFGTVTDPFEPLPYWLRTTAPSSRIPCWLVCGVVIAILALSAAPARAVKLPIKPGTAAFEKRSSSGSSALAPASNEQIDAAIATIKARQNEFRTHSLPDGINFQSGIPIGATPDEFQEWRLLTDRTLNLFDRRIMNLRNIKDNRQAARNLEAQRKDWRGFSEKPPYPLSLVDSLRNKINARQIDIHTTEMSLAASEGELADFTSALRESRTQQRLAGERLEQSIGKPDEARFRWLLALATRRNDLNETGAVTRGVQVQLQQEALALLRQELAFLNQKFAQAAGNFRFTREELDKRLKDIDTRHVQLKQDLEDALKAEDYERTLQEKARENLQRFKDSTPTEEDVSPRLEALRNDLEAQQVQADTAILKALSLRVLIRMLIMERNVWQNRFQSANPEKDLAAPDSGQIQKDRDTILGWKKFLSLRLDGMANNIRSQETRLSSPGISDRERSNARMILAAYQEQRNIAFRVDEKISGLEQLIQSYSGEISARTEMGRPVEAKMRNLLDVTLTYAGKIWNMELYVADETVVVDGQKIVKSRSVTIGKVVQALLIFFIGIAVAKRFMRPVSRLAARKFSLNENDTQVFGRVTYYLLFICILVSSLITVNIPLAVFAFFGGALAIGVGFGAQTLIGNFISGLILLFDRTISINDVVEVDGQRGRVTAISIRSSRIRRFDGVEVLVPNSHFLQQNVVNLTLSDPYTRFEIAVGVAYGSPTRIAEEAIFRAVMAQLEVQSDPAPFVAFEDFAESSLNFRAYFWIALDPSLNSSIIRSEIRHRIGEYLAEANISIPFPQRDLHLDTVRPLEVLIREERGTPEETIIGKQSAGPTTQQEE